MPFLSEFATMTAVCLQMYKHPNVFVFSFTLKMVCNFHLREVKGGCIAEEYVYSSGKTRL